MNDKEWDEAPDPEKISFGDEVITPNGEYGRVTELDGESELKYQVFSDTTLLGWFTREELTLVK